MALASSPAGLAARLVRATSFVWLLGGAALAVLTGTMAKSSARDVRGDRSVQQVLARLGGHGSVETAYLGLTFIVPVSCV